MTGNAIKAKLWSCASCPPSSSMRCLAAFGACIYPELHRFSESTRRGPRIA